MILPRDGRLAIDMDAIIFSYGLFLEKTIKIVLPDEIDTGGFFIAVLGFEAEIFVEMVIDFNFVGGAG